MNDFVNYHFKSSASSSKSILGIGAFVALAGLQPLQVDWPKAADPPYSNSEQGSSYSSFVNSMARTSIADIEFARNITALYASLSDGQEPLGREFEEIWDTHAENLYES